MATRTGFVRRVRGQAFPIGQWPVFADRRQVRIHSRRRRGDSLTQELLPREQAATGRRGVFRFTCQREKQSLAQYAGPLLARGKFGPIVIASRRRHLIYAGQIGVHEPVAGTENVHEVSVVPYEVPDKTPGFLNHGFDELRVEERKRTLLARRRLRPVEAEPLRGKLIERM